MSRANEIEKLKRIKAVSQWLSDGNTTAEIIHNIVVKWGLSERQAERYIKDTKETWKDDLRGEIEELRDFALKRANDSYTRLKKKLDEIYGNDNLSIVNQVQLICALEKQLSVARIDMAKLQGLYTEKIEHGGNIVYNYPPKIASDEVVESDDIV